MDKTIKTIKTLSAEQVRNLDKYQTNNVINISDTLKVSPLFYFFLKDNMSIHGKVLHINKIAFRSLYNSDILTLRHYDYGFYTWPSVCQREIDKIIGKYLRNLKKQKK